MIRHSDHPGASSLFHHFIPHSQDAIKEGTDMFVRRLAFSMLVVSSLIGQLSCCLPLPIGKTRANRGSSTPDFASTPYPASTPYVAPTPDFASTPAPAPTLELSVRPQQPS